jgi:DNA-binding transcriptional ArsR family regulator
MIIKHMLNENALDKIFHALADPTRRDIVDALALQSMSVTVLAQRYDMTLSAVSQHLKILIDGGLVTAVKGGRTRTCSIQAPALKAVSEWAITRRQAIESRLGSLERYLATERQESQ